MSFWDTVFILEINSVSFWRIHVATYILNFSEYIFTEILMGVLGVRQ